MYHMNRLTHRSRPQNKQPSNSKSTLCLKQNNSFYNRSSNIQTPLNYSYNDLHRLTTQTNCASVSKHQQPQRQIVSIKSTQKKRQTVKMEPKRNTFEQNPDFIKPEEIGISIKMNGKGVQSQLENAMKRQIQKQKSEIEGLNQTIRQLRLKEKKNKKQIEELNECIEELGDEMQNLKLQKKCDQEKKRQQQQIHELRDENQKLQQGMKSMQQMIKNLLLDREKEKMFQSNN